MGIEKIKAPSDMIRKSSISRPRVGNDNHVHNAFQWPERFFLRNPISYKWENLPWIAAKLNGVPLTSSGGEIAHFFESEQNWAADTYHTDAILDLFHGESLAMLQSDAEDVPTNKVALIIDGNISTGTPRLRPFKGGLSASEFLRELCEKSNEAQLKRYCEAEACDALQSVDIIDAERRLLCVVDLSAWTILSLVGSSPKSLARVLGDFIANYVRSRPSIGVSFATEGPQTFCLSFSFPYRAWRSTDVLAKDRRVKASDDEPLRGSRDVTFLRKLAGRHENVGLVDGIYSSHMSVMVTGYDEARWTGLGFLESWFEEILDDPSPDMISRYENDFSDGCLFDPLGRGKQEASISYWLPRMYFVCILEIRLRQVLQEWESLMWHLEKRVQDIAKCSREFLRERFGLLNFSSPRPDWNNVTQELEDWEVGIHDLKDVLDEIEQDIRETIRVGDLFMSADVNYFLNFDDRPDDGSRLILYLSQIRKSFKELRQLGMDLQNLQLSCRNLLEEWTTSRSSHNETKWAKPDSGHAPTQNVTSSESDWALIFARNLSRIFGTAILDDWANDELSGQRAAKVPGTTKHPGRKSNRFPHISVDFGGRVHHLKLLRSKISSSRPPNKPEPASLQADSSEANSEALIPLCVPIEYDLSPTLEMISSEKCQDDKTFFEALQNILKRRWKFTWDGLICYVKLRQPIGMHYVKFELFQDGLVDIKGRAQLPPPSFFASYRPVSSSDFELLPSYRLLQYYNRSLVPQKESRKVLDKIVHKTDGPFSTFTDKRPCTGYGLEIEVGLDRRRLEVMRFLLVLFSLLFGVGWSLWSDVQSGMSISAVLAVLSVVGVNTFQANAAEANNPWAYRTLV
ncbi:hypothetical protein CSIM01_05282 [Colletotrichum simmondsii]|uniref:Uncharacterized protein n=1 Tax=Colletotrichum simmondsii TaxID=703756 RepID=A0A135TGW7_9PEZI|nr:hypothetical protein CSIM01_05282 [Colletotrichum simmondsii]